MRTDACRLGICPLFLYMEKGVIKLAITKTKKYKKKRKKQKRQEALDKVTKTTGRDKK